VPAVPITIVWDNRSGEIIQQQEPETRRNIADILCGRIPVAVRLCALVCGCVVGGGRRGLGL